MRHSDHLPAAVAVALWLGLAIHTATQMSVTHDEFWHLPAGVRAWQGDFAVDRLNPPISRLWAALPLVISGMKLPPAEDASALGIQFVTEHADFLQCYVWGRIFHLLWPLATAVLLYFWSVKTLGLSQARLALICLLTCPNVLAHGSLVTPDAAAMFGFFATSFCLSRWLASPTWVNTLLLGGSLGALQGIKFTGVVFAPVLLIAGVWQLSRGKSVGAQPAGRLKTLVQLAAVVAFSLLVLAGSYGFQGLGRPFSKFPFQSAGFRDMQQSLAAIGSLPLPVPADYLLGVDQQRWIMEQDHPIFLDGVWREKGGFLSYYPKAVLYKLSHGFQLLILLGAIAIWRHHRSLSLPATWSIAGPVVLLFGLAMFSQMQLGLRYVLPLIPAATWWAGHAVYLLKPLPASRQALVLCAVMALSAWNLRYHPGHLAYFNELAGGPFGGRQHLLDSNLDWGQDLLRAKDFITTHADEDPRFLYFGTVPPGVVGLNNPFPPARQPKPGLYLVSVNFVMGRPHAAWQPDLTRRAVDFQEFGYFRHFKPVGHAGDSIDIYRLTAEDIRNAALRGKSR